MVFNFYSVYCVNANQLPTPSFYYMHDCQICSFNVPLQWCNFVSIPIPLLHPSYEQLKRLTIHRHSPSAFSVLWY